MSLFAGLDVGTQGVKLVVYDAELREVVATTAAPLDLLTRDDGSREQLAGWWTHAVDACFRALGTRVRRGIRALAVSGQQHGFVPLGAGGEVLAPVKLWCDTSTTRECDEIMQAVGGEARCIALAGNPVLVGYTASKVAWLRRHHPDAYRALDTILLPHDYINFYLTGERFCEAGDASGTGVFDVRERRWSQPLLEAVDPQRDLSQCLPPLMPPDATFPILPDIADALGLGRRVRVGVGGGDNMMAAIGTGCVAPGRLGMSLGTSGTLFTCADRPVVDAQGGWAAFCSSSGGWLPLVCTMNCTVATETIACLAGYDARAADACIAATPPGAGGLTLLPFFNGERTPNLPDASASLLGMRAGNMDAAHLHRAAMEGATYALRNGFDAMAATGLHFDSIVLTGGGSRSAAWRQMVSEVFDLPVDVPRHAEGAAFGAALQAMASQVRAGSGGPALESVVAAHVAMDPARTAHPDGARMDAYREPYARFRAHLAALLQPRAAGAGVQPRRSLQAEARA